MNRYSTQTGNDSGGFATSFSDMVFGLLFVFFLLSIALIFQRPEIDTFQDKIDALQDQLQEKTASLSQVTANRSKLEKANARLQRQVANLQASRQKLHEAKNEQQKMLLQSRKQNHVKAQAALRDLRLQLAANRQQTGKLQAALDRAEKRYRAATPQQLRRQLQAARKEVSERKKSIERLARDKKEFRAMLDAIKRLLRSTGQVDILAEVNQMERNLLAQGRRSGEDELLARSTVSVRFDPSQGLFGAEIQHSENDIEYWGTLREDELLRIASELSEDYQAISVSYTELEKHEHQPRILLSVHPDTPYWQVQELLQRIRSTLPVSIVPWDASETPGP